MPESSPLRRWLEARWHGESAPLLLRPLAWLYGGVVALRRLAYDRGWLASSHPGVPVIVVGNLTVGGTGKTPLVAWLATQLRARGARPGIVLRGHGGTVRGPLRVDAATDPALAGDEAVLLARATGCPVAVGRARAAAAALLAGEGCSLVIADDGLQHLALRRDLDIVVVDGGRGLGNGALLPAGPLRESPARLRAAGRVVVHGVDARGVARGIPHLFMQLEPLGLRPVAGGPLQPVASLRGQSLHAVAGIGHPQRFFAQLRRLGALPVEHVFPDHHRYAARDLAFGDERRIVMTAKDAVKCAAFATDRMWSLEVAAHLPEADAAQLLDAAVALLSPQGDARA
jgi:tetraacyldisaccharide 4'-kinase